LYEHRPKNNNNIFPEQICNNFGFQYKYQKDIEDILPYNSIILVCGAGIIPKYLIQNYRIINAHPGYIPNVRGLDALKWAIFEGQPIGVTTHQIGSDIDAGLIIERRTISIYQNDTFHAVAQRQYEIEISMLVGAIEKIDKATEYAEPGNYEVHKRMPPEYEVLLLTRFEELKKKVAIK
jgi:methionyl-tRNA formyltransferase